MLKINLLYILLSLWVAVTFPLTVFAQTTQSGYVKTKGRMDNNGKLIPGTRLSGAAITLTGGHSTVSGTDGTFKLIIPDKKYYLQNVQKKDYVLSDPEILTKQYVYSDNPLVITMETPAQQLKDQVEAQKKIEATLRQQLQQREKELEALKEAHKLTEEEYYKKLQQLYDEKATENLVKEMAKRYSEIDYDLIDSFQREFSVYILNGELPKADSLLKTKGNLSADVSELQQIREANIIEREKLERRRQQLDSSISYAQWLMEDIAMRCYNKAEIFKLRYQNDSVAYYLELRAGLDTTNVEWQIEVGMFLLEYLSKYDMALFYYERGLRQSLLQYGETSFYTATCYNNIGTVYDDFNNNKALGYYQKALAIRKQVFGEKHMSVVSSYNNIGYWYSHYMGNIDTALEYFTKALDILTELEGEEEIIEDEDFGMTEVETINQEIALLYTNIGMQYQKQGNAHEALKYLRAALDLYTEELGENSIYVAICNTNLGWVFLNSQLYTLALPYFEKALSIYKYNNMECGHYVSGLYSNFAEVYKKSGKEAEALQYSLKAYNCCHDVFGRNHQSTVIMAMNIVYFYYKQGDADKANEYFQESLLGNDLGISSRYDAIGIDYLNLGYYDVAINYFQKSLEIRRELSSDSALIAANYNNLGYAYDKLGKLEEAVDYEKKALFINKGLFGDEHPDVALSYNNLAMTYRKMEQYDEAIDNLQKALIGWKGDTENRALCYSNMGLVYCDREDYLKAVECFQKSLFIREKLYKEAQPRPVVCNVSPVAGCYESLYKAYYGLGDMVKAKESLEKARELYKSCPFSDINKIFDVEKKLRNIEQERKALAYMDAGFEYYNQGRFSEALRSLQWALPLLKNLYGENHSFVASCYNGMGNIYLNQGKFDKAEEYHEKALAIRKDLYGENQIEVAISYNNLGLVHYEKGEDSVAMSFFQMALAIFNITGNEKDFEAAKCYNNLGLAFYKQGQDSLSIAFCHKALDAFMSSGNEKSTEATTCYENLGFIYTRQGEYRKTIDYYEKSLTIRRSINGELHPSTAALYGQIAVAYYNVGKYNKVLEYCSKARLANEHLYGGDDFRVAECYVLDGMVYYATGDNNKALKSLQKALKIYESIPGMNYADMISVVNNLIETVKSSKKK